MSNFNYQDELKKIIETKQLVQVHFVSEPDAYRVGYILHVDEKCLVLAEVNDGAAFDGVTINRRTNINLVKADTVYANELAKQIEGNTIHDQALTSIKNIRELSFAGFVLGLEDTDIFVEVLTESDDKIAGKIVGHDNEALSLDEFRIEVAHRFGRIFVELNNVARISIGVPYLQVLSRAFDNINL